MIFMNPKNKRVIFFDMRNTLGVVDRPGHLIKFRPTTDYLLKMVKEKMDVSIGIISNAPPGVVVKEMLADAGILQYLDEKGIISTQDGDVKAVGGEKPGAAIYQVAARRMGVPIENCLYIGENLVEQLGAWAAGMSMGGKAFPPGGDFMRDPVTRGEVTNKSSGRLSEHLLKEDLIIVKRIANCAQVAKEKLELSKEISRLISPMTRLVWLTKHFIDPFYHRKVEEALLPFGLMHEIKPAELTSIRFAHEQRRVYFHMMELMLTRLQDGDLNAIPEIIAICNAIANLYKNSENDEESFKRIGDLLTDSEDLLLAGLIQRIGPPDITLYIDMITAMEKELSL